MGLALIALFFIAALLFVFSYYKSRQASKVEQREIDTIYMSLMEEVNKLQAQIRNMEIENEILIQRAGIEKEELIVLRDSLDLYKRGYTLEGIAGKMELDLQTVEQMISPYMTGKSEGRKGTNES